MDPVRQLSDSAEAKRLLSLAQTLLAQGGTLESNEAGEMIRRESLIEAVERRVELTLASGPMAKAAAIEAVENAERALRKSADGGTRVSLTDLEFASLEAIVEVTGRPAWPYRNGQVQMPRDRLGENERWGVVIAIARSKINGASASVGRISITGSGGLTEHVGTGWCAPGDLIVTNRHVVAEFVKDPRVPASDWSIDATRHPFIEFSADSAGSGRRFDIARIAYCAPEAAVDVALLRADAAPLPPPLKLEWDPAALGSELPGRNGAPARFRGNDIYVVGHPYRRRGSELSSAVIGPADGSKRWSPGQVTGLDLKKQAFEHDCSTLGGNSGSCVFSIGKHAVIGIHIGGVDVDEATGKGSANVALALSRLGAHTLAEILRTGKVAD